jgi:hypothetical protein
MNEEEHNRIVQQLKEAHTSVVAAMQFDIDRLREAHVPLQNTIDELRTQLAGTVSVINEVRNLVQ